MQVQAGRRILLRILFRGAKAKGQQIQVSVSCRGERVYLANSKRELQLMLFWRHYANPEDTEL